MSIYLDTSVIVPLFTTDVFTARAEKILEGRAPIVVSNIGKLEFTSVLARDYRSGVLSLDATRIAPQSFDDWLTIFVHQTEFLSSDITTAEHWLRRLDLTLRTVDAISYLDCKAARNASGDI